jgi:FlgD Ig-like domain
MKNKIKIVLCSMVVWAIILQARGQESSGPAPSQSVEIYSLEVGVPGTAEISLPIKVSQFRSSQTSFTLQWDPNIVTYMGTEKYGLSTISSANFTISQTSQGKLIFNWQSPNKQLESLAAHSILFAIRFKATGDYAKSTKLDLDLAGRSWPIGSITIGQDQTQPMARENLTEADNFTINRVSPTPFSRETRISYQLPQAGKVKISISDLNGRVVKNFPSEMQSRGNQVISWNGSDSSGNELKAGVYFCTLEYAGMKRTTKLVKAE